MQSGFLADVKTDPESFIKCLGKLVGLPTFGKQETPAYHSCFPYNGSIATYTEALGGDGLGPPSKAVLK